MDLNVIMTDKQNIPLLSNVKQIKKIIIIAQMIKPTRYKERAKASYHIRLFFPINEI